MYFKQVDEIARGWKQCTQRVCKEGEWSVIDPDTGEIGDVYDTSGRLKWHVGGTYAVSPGRGKRTAMITYFKTVSAHDAPVVYLPQTSADVQMMASVGYQPLRIRLTKIERRRLQTMTEAVAVAEGVATLAAYIELWTYINPGPLVNWDANPLVWRLWFEVARAV